ncbi:MAG: hypothetical protein E7288_11805 [Lachnospiraceae bacterium]|nr:hypothetical protein [Lachnospiraceae bacterium]
MKKCNKKIVRVMCGAVGIFCITLILMLVIPYSRFYAGKCIKVEMCVTEGEEYLIPENIVCMRGVENSEKIRIVPRPSGVILYIPALHYGKYTFEYDVKTSEGMRHFTYALFKTHNFGPRGEYFYRNLLQQGEDGEWYATVRVNEQGYDTKEETIELSEDANAYVQYGP